MQGAVGLAQLKKLDYIVKKQNINYNAIWNKIKSIRGIERRTYPKNSKISADALIFFLKDNKTAIKCREELLKYKISTKILPEAFTWHFSSEWTHIKELKIKKNNLKNQFKISKSLIRRAVSIPIFVNMKLDFPVKIKKSILKALQLK